MSVVRRSIAGAAFAVVAFTATVPFATSGFAASKPKCPNNGGHYPPGQCKKMQMSSSTVSPGGLLTLDATGFASGETVQVILHSQPVVLGTTTANSSGEAVIGVRIPKSTTPGTHTVIMRGLSSGVEVSSTIQVAGSGTTAGSYSGL